LTTKIHAVVDALGNPVRLFLTAGNINDSVPAIDLLRGLKSTYLIADKGYDAQTILDFATNNGQTAVIPPRSNRIDQRNYDKHLYKERHLIECFFQKLKIYRAITTRHEKLADTFYNLILIASCILWLK
jgi:transposase